jgi:hypothetical protein
MNTTLLLGLALLAGALSFAVAVRREEAYHAFRVGLGTTWVACLAVALVAGVLGDMASMKIAESPKFYATPFLVIAATGGGLVLGLIVGGAAAAAVRARQRRQVRSVLQANRQAAENEVHPYPEYFSIGKGQGTGTHTDA